MNIYLGADHGGFNIKEEIKRHLKEWGYTFEDLGAHAFDPNDDYPKFASATAAKVAEKPYVHRGILFCRSGVGMDIAANKIRGIRCAQVFTPEMARKSREHNNTNILSIATDYLTPEQIREIVRMWLKTPFSGEERHARRLKQIENLENQQQ